MTNIEREIIRVITFPIVLLAFIVVNLGQYLVLIIKATYIFIESIIKFTIEYLFIKREE